MIAGTIATTEVKEMSLLCPHCEKPFGEHDEKACRRRMSRRFFFGVLAAPLAVAILGRPDGLILNGIKGTGIGIAEIHHFDPLTGNFKCRHAWVLKDGHIVERRILADFVISAA